MADGEAMIVRPGGAAAFGLTPVERLRRSLARAGLSETATGEGAAMILRGDHIYGAGVIEALRDAPPATVLTDAKAALSRRGWMAKALSGRARCSTRRRPRAPTTTRRGPATRGS